MKNRMLAVLITVTAVSAFASYMVFAQVKPVEKKAAPKTAAVVKMEMKKDSTACTKSGDKACCKNGMVCPISGKPANKEIFSEYKGQKVYFCSKECKAAFDKDPAKYEAKMQKCAEACKKECKESGKKTEKPVQK
jgi:YHS domain-containing protein